MFLFLRDIITLTHVDGNEFELNEARQTSIMSGLRLSIKLSFRLGLGHSEILNLLSALD